MIGRPRHTPKLDPGLVGPVVYFIRSGDTGLVKIGRTDNVQRRLSELQTGNHSKVTLAYVVAGSSHEERKLHYRFKRHRERGEWFREEGGLADFLANKNLTPPEPSSDRVNSVPSLALLTGHVRGYCTTRSLRLDLLHYGMSEQHIYCLADEGEDLDECLRTFRDRPGHLVLATDLREFGRNKKIISETMTRLEKAKILVLDITRPEDDTQAALIQRSSYMISNERLVDSRRAVSMGRWGGEARGKKFREKRDALDENGLIKRIVNHPGLSWKIRGELLKGVASVSSLRRHYLEKN